MTVDTATELREVKQQLAVLTKQMSLLIDQTGVKAGPLVPPREARRILNVGKDGLGKLCGDGGALKEGVHWRWKNPEMKLSHREFYQDVIRDFALRGKEDPQGHARFCMSFHSGGQDAAA